MQYLRVLMSFFGHPWALMPEKFSVVADVLRRKSIGAEIPEPEIAAAVGQKRAGGYTLAGRGTAIIDVFGVISHRVSAVEECSGGLSTESIAKQLDAAADDNAVRKIVLRFDSPGGSVYGVQELAAKIRSIGERKKVVAIADPLAASAAYWLACQAQEVYVTPSGQVGSVGVIAEHADYSKADEKAGVKTTLVTAGKFKGEGHGAFPLSDEALGSLQKKVDAYYSNFVADVAKGRRISEAAVRKDYGEGRSMMADEARDAGMVDGVKTFEALLRQLTGDTTANTAVGARARAVEIS